MDIQINMRKLWQALLTNQIVYEGGLLFFANQDTPILSNQANWKIAVCVDLYPNIPSTNIHIIGDIMILLHLVRDLQHLREGHPQSGHPA